MSTPALQACPVQFTGRNKKENPAKREVRPPGPKGFIASAAASLATSGTALTIAAESHSLPGLIVAGLVGATSAAYSTIGTIDLLQSEHSVRRNYPVWARARWTMEGLRDVVQQDLLEGPLDGLPIEQIRRIIAYQMSKNEPAIGGFGTKWNVYAPGWLTLRHSGKPLETEQVSGMRTTIGGPQCKQPYSAARVNVSAMSYGAISKNAVLALAKGAKKGNFFVDTGEGGISPYHMGIQDPYPLKKGLINKLQRNRDQSIDFWDILKNHADEVKNAPDIVWELGTGYFGARDAEGNLDFSEFEKKARLPNVKMLELKISQGAKPGGGGKLPAEKNTEEIAHIRRVQPHTNVNSPAGHTAYDSPIGMIELIGKMRELSGGKPVGFKLCVDNPYTFIAYCKAMKETGIYPDFITVDGSEGGTGAAPTWQMGHMGTPLRVGLPFVHNMLTGFGIRDRIKIIASGKLVNPDQGVMAMAMGADLVNTARGFMLAEGCLQTNGCHLGNCPAGIATQDPWYVRALDVDVKAPRVYNYQGNYMLAMQTILGAAGVDHPDHLSPDQVYEMGPDGEETCLTDKLHLIPEGCLLSEETVPEKSGNLNLKQAWLRADPHSFKPVGGFTQIKPNVIPVQIRRRPGSDDVVG